MKTEIRHIGSFTARSTPYKPIPGCCFILTSTSNLVPRRIIYRNVGSRRSLQANYVTVKLLALRQYTLVVPISALPLNSQGAYIVGRYHDTCILLPVACLASCFLRQRTCCLPPPFCILCLVFLSSLFCTGIMVRAMIFVD